MNKNLPQESLMASYKADLERIVPYLQDILPHKGGVQRFVQMAKLAALRDRNLLGCTRLSILKSIIWCAQKGLEPGVDDGCWIIPFKVKGVITATPVPAYKGLMRIAEESVKLDIPQCVYEHDEFEYILGLNQNVHHKPPKLGSDRGRLIGVYVTFTLPNDSRSFHVMDRLSVEKIRNSGAAWKAAPNSGPWKDWEDSMFRKTVIKQALKYIPLKSEIRDLINDDNRLEAGESIATLLRESGTELPSELEEPEGPPPDPDTAEFDKMVAERGLTEVETERLGKYLDAIAKNHKVSVAQAKVMAALKADEFWAVFPKWVAKNYPAESPEPPEEPPGEEPPPPNSQLSDRANAAWRRVVELGIDREDLTELGINVIADINDDNIGALEEMVEAKTPKKGRKKA